MRTTLSRRDFLKASIAAATATTVGLPLPQELRAVVDPESGWRWDKGACRFCGVGCGIQVATHGGKVVAVKGDPDCDVNRGLLCVKGYANAEILYGEDRVEPARSLSPPQRWSRCAWPSPRRRWRRTSATRASASPFRSRTHRARLPPMWARSPLF